MLFVYHKPDKRVQNKQNQGEIKGSVTENLCLE